MKLMRMGVVLMLSVFHGRAATGGHPLQPDHLRATSTSTSDSNTTTTTTTVPKANFSTTSFDISVRNSTQTIERLSPAGAGLSYASSSTIPLNRSTTLYEHLGDLTFRIGNQTFSSAAAGDVELPRLPPPAGGQLSGVDLTRALPSGCPVTVTRRYVEDTATGDLLMRFELRSRVRSPVEITNLGMSMAFDQVFSGRSLGRVAEEASFNDPYIGGGAGYVQVVSTTGKGPVLLVLPETEPGFEGWRMLTTDPTPRSVTFEGFYELLLHSAGYANNEWAAGKGPWNPPTSKVVQPGEVHSVTVRFALASSLQHVDATLLSRGRPVVTAAVPGYILSPTMSNCTLTLALPPGAAVEDITTDPPSALTFAPLPEPNPAAVPAAGQARRYRVSAAAGVRGRVRVSVSYSGLGLGQEVMQYIHYYVVPDLQTHAHSYAWHLSRLQFYNDSSDPFHRAPAFMNWDARPAGGGWDRRGVRQGRILQDQKAWVAGLSDECGAAPSVGMAVSMLRRPQQAMVAQLDAYANGTLWGGVQLSDHGVRASTFFAGKQGFPYTVDTWGTWGWGRSMTTWRSYNYPHVTVVWWVLYRLARNYELSLKHPWQWYLNQAVNTTLGMQAHGQYNGEGLMVGSVWVHLLRDVQQEAAADPTAEWGHSAMELQQFMSSRAAAWSKKTFPFGSEMPWDSTGQEEVYVWARHFNYTAMADLTLSAVLAYNPRIPHWAYNGNARRYFDFLVYGGENDGTERLFHHYGAPLNAIPVLQAFRSDPDNVTLLEIGLGGLAGSMTSIDPDTGSPSMGWHGSEQRLYRDPTSCDYGVGFYGVAMESGAYFVSVGGELRCYLCDLVPDGGGRMTIFPLDAFRTRLFLGPLGLDVVAEAAQFSQAVYSPTARTLVLTIDTSQAAHTEVAASAARSLAVSHWGEVHHQAITCTAQEYKGRLACGGDLACATADLCKAAAEESTVGANYAVWRGDIDHGCHMCNLTGSPEDWAWTSLSGNVSFYSMALPAPPTLSNPPLLPPRARVRLDTPALYSGRRGVTSFAVRAAVGGLPLQPVRGAYEVPLLAGRKAEMIVSWSEGE